MRIAIAMCVIALFAAPASAAGPIRERIAERRAERAASRQQPVAACVPQTASKPAVASQPQTACVGGSCQPQAARGVLGGLFKRR